MGIITVLWEKWVEFKRDFYKITVAAMISPLMYLIIFGMGIQTTSHGEPYLHFLIPGIVAMATMTGSFSAITQNMSVQRLYEKALDQIMVSPTPLWQFILGQILGLFRTGFGSLGLEALGLQHGMGTLLLICGGVAAAVDGLRARGRRVERLQTTVLPYYLVMAALLLTVAVYGVYGSGFNPQDFVYFKY